MEEFAILSLFAGMVLFGILMAFSTFTREHSAGYSLLFFDPSTLGSPGGPSVIIENHEGAPQDYSISALLGGKGLWSLSTNLSDGASFSIGALQGAYWDSTLEVRAWRPGKPVLLVYASPPIANRESKPKISAVC
jgi:ABC-type transport system involved in multi-copper enzyme maturation permease subunit